MFGRKTMRVLGIVALFAIVVALLLVLLNWFISPDTAQERQGLALVFAISLGGVAGIFGLYFTWQTLRTTREHEATRAREAALRACLVQLGSLLTHDNWSIEDKGGDTDNTLRRLARAEVLSVLGTLDGPRKRILVRFLYESNLLDKNITAIDLHGADLREADLSRLTLSDSLLSEVRLRGANLSYAILDGAILSGSDLCEEFLRWPSDSDLSRANLEGTSLRGTDLSGVDLRETENLTQEQLVCVVGSDETELPQGLDRPELWRKSFEEQRKIIQEQLHEN